MNITPISCRLNTYNRVSFKGIRDVTRPYDEERNELKNKTFVWNKEGKLRDIDIREAAATKAYALAQEERLEDMRQYNIQRQQDLQLARLNNENKEKIAKLEAEVLKSNEILRIQSELSKIKQNKGWDRIAGYDQEKNILTDEFISNISLEKAGNKDITFPNGILFFGPTGNGKTTFAKAFAEQTQCPLIEISPYTDNLQRDIREALNTSKETFEQAGTRSIILMDEFDNFGANIETNKQNIAMLKAVMTECSDKYNATMFLTTNNPQDIDSILLADSRCPIRVYLDPPNKENAKIVFKYYLNNKTDNYMNYENIVNELFNYQGEGAYSNSRIKTIVETCFKEVAKQKRKITEGDIIAKIKTTLPDITKEHLQKYAQDVKALTGIIR